MFWLFGQFGVRVLIADMPHYDSANRRGVMICQIKEAIDEENRKNIIERYGKAERPPGTRSKRSGGNAPYRYRRRAKRLLYNM